MPAMTKLLEEAIATLRTLPEDDQDMAAKFLLGFANPDAHKYRLNDRQAAEVEQAQRDVRAGKIASDASMAEVWQRFRR